VSLRLHDRWLWDFWVVRDGPDFHVFYLQAPRSLRDPELRHRHASIGHAVSSDLRHWNVLSDALGPGEPGAWDDSTVWTGSIEPETRRAGAPPDGWRLLYTGTARATGGLVQRIGLATSPDLLTWTRHAGNPVLEPDHALYEGLGQSAWHEEAWRDPWLFRDPASGARHALITARASHGPVATRGVIALATAESDDRWSVGLPITRPGVYGHMEIPQLHRLADGRWCLLFSVPGLPDGLEAGLGGVPPRAGLRGTHYLVADAPLGPFEWQSHGVLLADEGGTWYGAKLLEGPDGRLTCLAWAAHDAHGGFVGELSDPMEVIVDRVGPRVRAS
jgi:beta-fructofuranosidase